LPQSLISPVSNITGKPEYVLGSKYNWMPENSVKPSIAELPQDVFTQIEIDSLHDRDAER
jgi:hypothetical protein